MFTRLTRSTTRRLLHNVRFSSTGTIPTIYALSTHLTRSAIGVIRISGTQSKTILNELTLSKPLPKPRVASVRRLFHPKTEHLLDEALTIYFPEPRTYTGEDLVELHVHGGVAVIQSVLRAIETLHTPTRPIRYAEAGEFSRRAFQNGRFDLTEIEGIRELIDAETETARIAAVNSATGQNKLLFKDWRERLVKNVGLLTAIIDFAEDTEIEDIEKIYNTVLRNIDDLQFEMNVFLERGARSELLLKGIKVILLGPPNAGKSSVLNKLASTEAAIVSDIAGTTRDVINVPLNIKGYKVVVGDTAGIRDLSKADRIEVEGIKRAKMYAEQGDLVLVVLPVNDLVIDDELRTHVSELQKTKDVIVILNKCDLLEEDIDNVIANLSKELSVSSESFIPVSCLENMGIEELSEKLVHEFKHISLTESTDPIILTARVRDILVNDVLHGFDEFKTFKELDDVVLATEGLQQSIEGIGKITGETVGVEEVLGVVFSSFCVGK
ncbi:CYFA0S01e07756g1_1 [Cyberlindnera fabianii]|uniref:CYFA0S01e07756g1_1 n=1 Tax=Cyberlindnera fabianii TaxID=36022 RepID=A0A061AP45_CYBFA|nr:CYFA0S01e07756g1_1 [Cyberlindnera fabianii]